MSDEYNAVWPGTYGHIYDIDDERFSLNASGAIFPDKSEEPSWADIVLEQAIEETMLARAERKR